MNNDITAEIENNARKGAEFITEFAQTLTSLFYDELPNALKEFTINGKYHNSKLDILNQNLFKSITALKKHLGFENNVDVSLLLMFVEYSRNDLTQAKLALKNVFKDIHTDDEDKELCHKQVTIYNELVLKYENVLFKLSLKNLQLRAAFNNGELALEKVNLKKIFTADQIIEMMTEFEKHIKLI
jgi:hypothetical protein